MWHDMTGDKDVGQQDVSCEVCDECVMCVCDEVCNEVHDVPACGCTSDVLPTVSYHDIRIVRYIVRYDADIMIRHCGKDITGTSACWYIVHLIAHLVTHTHYRYGLHGIPLRYAQYVITICPPFPMLDTSYSIPHTTHHHWPCISPIDPVHGHVLHNRREHSLCLASSSEWYG